MDWFQPVDWRELYPRAPSGAISTTNHSKQPDLPVLLVLRIIAHSQTFGSPAAVFDADALSRTASKKYVQVRADGVL